MLSDEQKVRIAKKVAEASASHQASADELLGPSYEGVCKACEVCTSTVTEQLEVVAIGYARRYVRRQKFGSKADTSGKWNKVEPDKRDKNIFHSKDFNPLDVLLIIFDLPNCIDKLTEDEKIVVSKLTQPSRTTFNLVAKDLNINIRTVQSRWESALCKMRDMLGVRR